MSTATVHLFRRRDERVPAGVRRAVEEAVAFARVVRIEYLDREGAPTVRAVEPAGLVRGVDGWYLVGWCRLRGDGRAFRLDRIMSASLLTERAAVRRIRDMEPDVPLGYAVGAVG